MKIMHWWDFPGGPVVKTSPSNAGGAGSINSQGAGIPHASRPKNQNVKWKQYCNWLNKDFKNGPHQKKKSLKKEKKEENYALVKPLKSQKKRGDFPGGVVVENLPANAGDTGSSPGLGGSHMPRSN